MEDFDFIISFDIGIKNLAVCKMNSKKDILIWELLNTNGKIDDIISKLNKLDLINNCVNNMVYCILLEQQPKYNPKMRIISAVIETYFKTLNINSNKLHVKKISSNEKWKPLGIIKFDIDSYYKRKCLSISLCKNLIISPTWKCHFLSHKKQDDLADCFLQGYTYQMI
ncbi:hypothetical protein [Heterosigma akashiwo virus 01]|jgi:hypothetical protein|uniref:Holliday junction resolvase n=1 Tax=Heterosigma akashiwo virus 01 TaxID=97195 RepID=A0A1C9C576_HAV01|nr:hypothetical protein D1R72_gp111 [Heterosigma akashiwo virus 01]AOM63442.1 hypothetical protein [Heterosigma akashiwo virus 01]